MACSTLRRLLPLLVLALAIAPAAGVAQSSSQEPAPPSGVYGDVNGDGEVTVLDALAVLAHVTGRSLPPEYHVLPNGDANGDGQVTAVDALVIAAGAVGRDVSRYPVGQAVPGAVLPPAEGGSRAAALAGYTVGVNAGDNQIGWAGDSLRAAVQAIVRNGSGTPVASVTVYWTILGGGGGLRVASSSSGATGIATNKWLPGTPGTATLRASIRDATGATISSADFTATAVDPATSSIAIQAGDLQTGVAGDTVPAMPTVLVKDGTGTPIKGVSVAWEAASGGGSVPLARTTTSTSGLAGSWWVFGSTAGTQTLTAQIPGGGSVTFSADVLSRRGTITKLADHGYGIAGDSMATGGWVEVKDSLGNPMSVYVYWTPQDGGSVTATRSRTSSAGRAATRWKLGPNPGVQHLLSRVDSIGTVTTTATAVPLASVVLTKRADAQSATGGSTVTVYLDVKDTGNNPISTWAAYAPVTGGSPTPPGRAPTAITTGRAVINWTLGTPRGVQTLQASVGAGARSVTFTALSTLLASDSLVKVAGSTTGIVGQDVLEPPTVRVADSAGNVVPNYPVVFAVDSGGGAVDPGTGGGYKSSTIRRTDSAGIAVLPHWKLGPAAGVNTLRVTAGAKTLIFTATATAAPGPPASVSVYSGSGQSAEAGTALPDSIAAVVRDANGMGVPGVNITWFVSSGGGSLSPTTGTTDAQGIARSRWTLGSTVGSQTARAVVTGLPYASFTATGQSPPITVGIWTPLPGTVVGDTLQVKAKVTSTYEVTSVVATVADRQVTLTHSGTDWIGTLILTGLPQASTTLTVTATDYYAHTASSSVTFTHALPPTLSVTYPINGTVVRSGSARVAGSCEPAGCTVGAYIGSTLLASATNTLDVMVSFASREGTKFRLEIRATGTASLKTSAYRRMYVESSSHLTEVAAASGLVWDVDATRLLYYDSLLAGGSLNIRNRSSGADVFLKGVGRDATSLHLDTVPQYGYLTSAGAVFATWAPTSAGSSAADLNTPQAWDWNGAVLTPLTAAGALRVGSLNANGAWEVWQQGTTLMRRDAGSGIGLTVATGLLNDRPDVAASGDVVYTKQYQLFRYRDGINTQLSTDGSSSLSYSGPLTDGTSVVHSKNSAPNYRIGYMEVPPVDVILSGPRTQFPAVRRDYDIAGGWTAFTTPSADGALQVWTRSPTGELRQVTFFGSDSRVAGVGTDGTVIYTHAGRRYVSVPDYTAPAIDIGADFGDPAVNVRGVAWRDGQLLVLIGRSVFRVTY
jgi:hypothetical protein